MVTDPTGNPKAETADRPGAERLVDPDHQVAVGVGAGVVGQLHGGDHDAVVVHGDQRLDRGVAGNAARGQVEPVPLAGGVEQVGADDERVAQPVVPQVGLRVGNRGARSSESRTVVVVPPSGRTVRETSWPYVESLTTASP